MQEQVQMEQGVVCLPVLPEGTWTRRPLWSGSSRELYRSMHFYNAIAPKTQGHYRTRYIIQETKRQRVSVRPSYRSPKRASTDSWACGPLFLKILFHLLHFALSRQQIHPFLRDRTAAVVVFPPYEEQTEEWKGDVCATNFSQYYLTYTRPQ